MKKHIALQFGEMYALGLKHGMELQKGVTITITAQDVAETLIAFDKFLKKNKKSAKC